MKPNAERLCGVPSNCLVCRTVPEHRHAIGWPDECPRGVTAEAMTKLVGPQAGLSDTDRERQAERVRRQEHLCESVDEVVEWKDCCGGRKRPLKIVCARMDDEWWATCLACKDYVASDQPAKVAAEPDA